MRSFKLLPAMVALLASTAAFADDIKVGVGISGWTGFAPLTLAKEAGIFKKNGLDVEIKMIPQKDRHLAIASGDIQCAATTVETWVVWNANGVATTQIFQLDKSYGADGMVVKPGIAKISDLKGKTIGVSSISGPPRNFFAILLSDNGLDPQSDVQWLEFPADLQLTALQRGEIQAIADSDPNAWLTERRANGDLVEIASNLSVDYANLS